MVQERDDVVGIDAAIIMNPKVWEASGHVATFTDPMVDCKSCKHRFRADHIEGNVCPDCGAKDSFTEARAFNLMFKTTSARSRTTRTRPTCGRRRRRRCSSTSTTS